MANTRCYRDGVIVAEGFPVADVSDYLADPANAVWFDLCAPDDSDLRAVHDELGLHSLAVEDAIQAGERPKLDHYAEHLFVNMYAVSVDPTTQQLHAHEVSVFVTNHAVVTVRADEGFDIADVTARWDAMPNLAKSGTGFLLHGLIDYVVDSHFDAVQKLDTEIDKLEDELFEERARDVQVQRQAFEARKSLVEFRRLVLPMREVVNSLLRRDLGVVDATMAPYYQDVYDHILRVTEWTESLRDLISNIHETRLTIRGNRLNVIMKKVTSWAAIIAVPTAVTGFYGQNVPYPGSGQMSGVWTSAIIMVVLSVGLYAIFKIRDWL